MVSASRTQQLVPTTNSCGISSYFLAMPPMQQFLSEFVPYLHDREDYLKTATPSISSFHFRTGHAPLLNYPAEIAPKSPANSFGYPQPGPQSPTPAHATAKHYFVDDNTWETILDHGEFDDVVVGSGFCALAYVDMALKRDPWRKILILERGGMSLWVYCVFDHADRKQSRLPASGTLPSKLGKSIGIHMHPSYLHFARICHYLLSSFLAGRQRHSRSR